jgi:hypothetical protein
MKINKISFSTLFAIGSFLIGTILFVLFQITKNENLLFIGFFYVLFAIFFNTLVFFSLVHELLFKINKEETIIKILILLSNIPIAYLYLILTVKN